MAGNRGLDGTRRAAAVCFQTNGLDAHSAWTHRVGSALSTMCSEVLRCSSEHDANLQVARLCRRGAASRPFPFVISSSLPRWEETRDRKRQKWPNRARTTCAGRLNLCSWRRHPCRLNRASSSVTGSGPVARVSVRHVFAKQGGNL